MRYAADDRPEQSAVWRWGLQVDVAIGEDGFLAGSAGPPGGSLEVDGQLVVLGKAKRWRCPSSRCR